MRITCKVHSSLWAKGLERRRYENVIFQPDVELVKLCTEYLFAFGRIWRLSVMQSSGGVEKNVIKNPQFTPKCSPYISPIGNRFEILFFSTSISHRTPSSHPARNFSWRTLVKNDFRFEHLNPLPPPQRPHPFRIGSAFGELIKKWLLSPPRFGELWHCGDFTALKGYSLIWIVHIVNLLSGYLCNWNDSKLALWVWLRKYPLCSTKYSRFLHLEYCDCYGDVRFCFVAADYDSETNSTKDTRK